MEDALKQAFDNYCTALGAVEHSVRNCAALDEEALVRVVNAHGEYQSEVKKCMLARLEFDWRDRLNALYVLQCERDVLVTAREHELFTEIATAIFC